MAKKKQKQSSLKLTDKKHPPLAIGATFVGLCSGLGFFAVCMVSSQSHGKSGMYIGAWGIFCLLLSGLGFVMAWVSLRKDNIRTFFPSVAAVINGLVMVFYILLYFWGSFI